MATIDAAILAMPLPACKARQSLARRIANRSLVVIMRRRPERLPVPDRHFYSGEVWDLEQTVAIIGESQQGRQLKDNRAYCWNGSSD